MFNCSKSTITINGKTFKNTSATLQWLIDKLGIVQDDIKDIEDTTADAVEEIKNTTAFKRDVSKITTVVPTYAELVAQLQEDGVEDPENYLAMNFGITADTDLTSYASDLSIAIGYGSNISGKGCTSLGGNNIISDGVLSNAVGALNQIKGTKSTAVGYYTNTEANNAINVGVGGLSGWSNPDDTTEQRYFEDLATLGVIDSSTDPISIGVIKSPVSAQVGSNHLDMGENETHPIRYQYSLGFGNYNKGRDTATVGYQNIGEGRDIHIHGVRNLVRGVVGGFCFGSANEINPDNNAEGDTDVRGVFQIGMHNKSYGDTDFTIGVSNISRHENVYSFGRNIRSAGSYQCGIGFSPAMQPLTLFAVGDGTDAQPHNLMVAYKNATTQRATHMWVNTRLLTEGNVESDKKVIAKQAPTQDNDCIRWQEYQALLRRIEALESADSGHTLTFTSNISNTNFTLSVDGGPAIQGADCAGNSYTGTNFVFTAINDVEVGVWYRTESDSQEVWLNNSWLYNNSATLTLTENATITMVSYH